LLPLAANLKTVQESFVALSGFEALEKGVHVQIGIKVRTEGIQSFLTSIGANSSVRAVF
jgi:hypothetical protein